MEHRDYSYLDMLSAGTALPADTVLSVSFCLLYLAGGYTALQACVPPAGTRSVYRRARCPSGVIAFSGHPMPSGHLLYAVVRVHPSWLTRRPSDGPLYGDAVTVPRHIHLLYR